MILNQITNQVFQSHIAEGPTFVSVIRPETLAEYGSTVTLPCEAIGVPAPNITWLRNARDVLSLPQKERYVLKYYNLYLAILSLLETVSDDPYSVGSKLKRMVLL
jgi:hypothetical protein